MTCCLIAVLLMDRVVRFFGRPWKILLGQSAYPASVPPALGTWGQAVLESASATQVPRPFKWSVVPAVAAELTAAWLLWSWLAAGTGAEARPSQTQDVVASTHHHHGLAEATVQGTGWLGEGVLVPVVGSALLGMACMALVQQRSSRFLMGLAAASCLVGIVPVPGSTASPVHVVSMIQMELLLLVTPALLAFAWMGRVDRGFKPARHTVWNTALAVLSVVVLPVVTLAGHVPSINEALIEAGFSALVRPACFLACGLAVWWFAIQMPTNGRSLTGGRVLLLAYGASSLIGIAMILGPAPLMSSGHVNGLLVDSLTDQRLAGLVMMLADILVVFPALRKLLAVQGNIPRLPQETPA